MLRTQRVLNWPGQVTIAGCQTYWTLEVEEALEAAQAPGRGRCGEGLGREHTAMMALQWPVQLEFLGTPREGAAPEALGWKARGQSDLR